MTNEYEPLSDSDLNRYGKRLQGYLPALKEFNENLLGKKLSNIDEFLELILPELRTAFRSDIAFLADDKGKIFHVEPAADEKGLLHKMLTGTDRFNLLIEKGDPLIADKIDGENPELKALNVDSMMVLRMETPGGFRFVGVVNGKNEPAPYLSEDKILLNELLKIIFHSMNLEKEKLEKEIENQDKIFRDRYESALQSGEWENLFYAARDYARHLFSYESNRKEEWYKIGNIKDEVLADYLEAGLCSYLVKTPRSSQGHDSQDKKNAPSSKQRPWDIVEKENDNLRLKLKADSEEKNEIPIKDYPRTALTACRIFMVEIYFPGVQELDTKKKNIDSILEKFEGLFKEKPSHGGLYNYELHVDWLRANWQYIYNDVSQAVDETLDKGKEKIFDIYSRCWEATVRLIKNHLEGACGKKGFCVDSDWPMVLLAMNLLLSKRINRYFNFFNLTPGESDEKINDNPFLVRRYLKNLSHHILYVLHCARYAKRKKVFETKDPERAIKFKPPPFADVPADPTSSLSRSLLYLLSEYAYREIGVNRELHILEKLSLQLYFELPLYAASSFYRDHIYHVMDVCLLGEFLLRNVLLSNSPKNKPSLSMLDDLFLKRPLTDLLKNWYVAALCHDLGYIIEQTDKFLKPYNEIKGEGIYEFSKRLEEGVKTGKKEIREIIDKIVKEDPGIIPQDLREKLLNSSMPTDHGIIGWLNLRHWIKETREPVESFTPALVAVLRHNLPDQEIDIYKEPLSFLLLLCDHLQEWGRPRVSPDPLAQGLMESLRFPGKSTYDQKIRMSKMIIQGLKPKHLRKKKIPLQMCDNCFSPQKKGCKELCLKLHPRVDCKSGLTFILPHQEAREADFEPCISWLKFCRDFQRDADKKKPLPFPITIQFEHLPSRIWSELPSRPMEMDIFEEYSSTHTPAAYLCEWIECARNHKEGISYQNDRGKGEETFILHLHELGKPLKRGLSEEHWKDFFKWKWNRLGSQYLKSSLGSLFPLEE
jgi:hypothetical protein